MELLHLPYSPWSEKARWAFDLRGLKYRGRTYRPILGEPALRWRLRQWRGPVSVPVLVVDGRAIADSFEIARYADGLGEGPRLFPEGSAPALERYNELSERGLAAGRTLALGRLLDDQEGLLEMVPRSMRALRPLASRIARGGVERTLRKYLRHGTRPEAVLTEVLDTLRRDLAGAPANEPRTLLGELTYADVAMAQVLVFVQPPKTGLRIGKGSRRAFHDPRMAELYPDLLEWRDALYARYRAP